jgi:hypothetical protein
MESPEDILEKFNALPQSDRIAFFCHALWAYDRAPERARKAVEEYGGDYEKTLEYFRRGIFETDEKVEELREFLAKHGYGPKKLEAFPDE